MSTYEERQAIRDANPGVIVEENSVYNPSTGQTQSIADFTGGGTSSSGDGGVQSGVGGGEWQAADGQTLNGQSIQTQQDFLAIYGDQAGQAWANEHNAAMGAGPATQTPATTAATGGPRAAVPGAPVAAPNQAVQQLGGQIDSLLKAIASGNAQAFAEAVRQFDVTFGLDKDKFTEAIRQFNENLQIAQSGVTGQFQGQATLPALTSYATQFGQWGVPQQGAQTLESQRQWAELYGANAAPTAGQSTLAAQQQAYNQQLGAITTAAGLQANPFRQAQVIGQLGGLLGGGGVAGFQAPGQAQGQTDFSGMGNMQRLIDDIRGGPNAINSQSTQGVLDAIPTPTKLNSVEFSRASPMTQNLVLQGIQEKYGLDPKDALAQIQNTLPQFQAPTTMGQLRR